MAQLSMHPEIPPMPEDLVRQLALEHAIKACKDYSMTTATLASFIVDTAEQFADFILGGEDEPEADEDPMVDGSHGVIVVTKTGTYDYSQGCTVEVHGDVLKVYSYRADDAIRPLGTHPLSEVQRVIARASTVTGRLRYRD